MVLYIRSKKVLFLSGFDEGHTSFFLVVIDSVLLWKVKNIFLALPEGFRCLEKDVLMCIPVQINVLNTNPQIHVLNDTFIH